MEKEANKDRVPEREREREVCGLVDAGKRKTREKTVHGNERDLSVRVREYGGCFARIYVPSI